MYLRRFAVPVAAIAAGAAFLPVNASAATTPASSRHAPAAHGTTFTTGAGAAPEFKTYSSPATKSVRLQKGAAAPVKSRTAATGKTIYADVYPNCTTETGDGSQANPYCNLQDAVNAAVSGDTVDAIGDGNGYFMNTLTVTTSGISIVGVGGQNPGIFPELGNAGKPALVIDGASNVTVSNLFMSGFNAPAVEVIGSSNLTFDSDSVTKGAWGNTDTLTIDGSSSDITVSRTYLDNGMWTAPGHEAVSIAAGASNITFATDAISASGIKATGVNGLNVVGSTIERACAGAIDIEGASSAVYLENNLVEDVNNGTDGNYYGGLPSQCSANSLPWSPSITVSADSSAHTTSDYNAFHSYGTDNTEQYSWAGTSYSTLAAFQAAVGQGAHDAVDTTEPMWVYFRDAFGPMDARPITGSSAINSVNASAPGQLSSDIYGTSPYTTRGAIQYVPTDPTLAASISATATSALGFSVKSNITNGNVMAWLTVDFGDGNTPYTTSFTGNYAYTDSYRYSKAGTYTISVTVDDHMGDIVTNSVQVKTAGSDYTAYGPVRILDTRTGTGIGGTAAKVGSDATVKLQVTGAGPAGNPIPAGITAVVLNLTVTNPASGGYLTAYPNQGYGGVTLSRPTSSNVNFSAGQTVPNLAIVPVGPDGIVDLYNGSGGATNVIADVTGYFSQTQAAGYFELEPDRLVDTRSGFGAPKAPVAAGGSIGVQITGADGGELPAGIAAVALNVTAVAPQAGGYLTVYPDGTARPTASNVNFGAGQVIANSVVVPVGADGKIRIFNGSIGGTNVLVDIVGYYGVNGNGAYLPVTPQRILDSRKWQYGPITPGGYAYTYSTLSTTDRNVISFVLNTTVTDTQGSGYETVSPDPNSLQAYQGGYATFPTPPNVSTLNWTRGQTVPNLVQAGTGSYGIIDYWNRSGGNMDLVVDEFGYYQAD